MVTQQGDPERRYIGLGSSTLFGYPTYGPIYDPPEDEITRLRRYNPEDLTPELRQILADHEDTA